VDNVLSEYLWAMAVLLTSPSVATVGLSLTVPLAMLSDLLLPEEWLVDPHSPDAFSVAAAIAVVAGFVAINCASDPPRSARRNSGHEPCSWWWYAHTPLLGRRVRAPPGVQADRDAPATAEASAGRLAGSSSTCAAPHYGTMGPTGMAAREDAHAGSPQRNVLGMS